MRNRTMWLVGVLGIALALGAAGCSGGTSGGGDAPATLSSISGPVAGYEYSGVSNVQAFAPNDGALLASGQVYPEPDSRVEGDLTAVGNIPSASFVNPYFCNNATVSPSSMRTTGIVALGVSDSGGTFGVLIRATAANPDGPVSVGDRIYFYFVATTGGRVSGNCVLNGVNATYDIDLARGWNHVSARVDAIDSFGNPVAYTYTDQAPGAGAMWHFGDASALSGSSESAEAEMPAVETLKRAFPAF